VCECNVIDISRPICYMYNAVSCAGDVLASHIEFSATRRSVEFDFRIHGKNCGQVP